MLADFSEHCNTIEECYEFMLAYAAQGFPVTKAVSPADRSANIWAAP